MVRALIYTAPRQSELRAMSLDPPRAEGDVLVRMTWSGLSRGTERLVFEGRVPEAERRRMRAPFQDGDFPFPVKYGYSAVGRVEQGPAKWLEKAVFCLFPHQEAFVVPESALVLLPEDLPPKRAVLAANMETALNAIWDSGAGPGDRIAIVGGGILGGLLAGILGAIPGAEVTLVDVEPSRAALADHMNVFFSVPEHAPPECDVVFHTSCTGAGAATALACGGMEARIIEMSWFGDVEPPLPLGGAFHSRRLSYISSQVGQVAPSRRPRWPYARRIAKALDLLRDDRYDALITGEVAFGDLPAMLPTILAPGAPGLATAIRYGE